MGEERSPKGGGGDLLAPHPDSERPSYTPGKLSEETDGWMVGWMDGRMDAGIGGKRTEQTVL